MVVERVHGLLEDGVGVVEAWRLAGLVIDLEIKYYFQKYVTF